MRKYQFYSVGEDGDYDGYSNNWLAQTFTVELVHMISKVKLKLFRVGDPGTVQVSIKATLAGKATGADLASGIIEGTDITVAVAGDWYEITLGSGYTFEKDTMYAIVVRAPDGDGSNKVSWLANLIDGAYSGGTVCTSSDSGVDWGIISGADFMFEEWGVGDISPALGVWGLLPKSQIDSETIETAINRLILVHAADEESHLGVGESLQSHKASAIIDHLASSIIADKIKEWEEVKLGGTFDRNDLHFFTFFESIDGYSVAGDGTIVMSELGLIFTTAAFIGSFANMSKLLLDWTPVLLTWDKRRKLRLGIMTYGYTNQQIWVGLGGLFNERHVGFKVNNGTLYGTVADGSTEATLNLGTPGTSSKALEVVFIPGVSAEFLINGASQGTITTNLPTGLDLAYGLLTALLYANDTAITRMRLTYWEFWQDK